MFTTLTVKDKDYKLRLNAKACVDLEKKLGTNPVNVLMAIAEKNQIPTLNTVLIILQASLSQYNHGMSMDDVYGLYDNYVEDGHTMLDLIPVILSVFKESGLVPDEGDEGKN